MFLALEPDDAAAEVILRYKQRLAGLVGDQLYLRDPPHMTLYLAMFTGTDAVLDAARHFANSLKAPQLSLAGWHAFLADPLTGFNTLVLDFQPADRTRLRKIQRQVVEAVSTKRDAAATLDRINGRLTNLSQFERETAYRWGFPYIGKGWHPHLTIASIRPEDWPVVEQELLIEKPTGTVFFPRLKVYQLIGGQPHLIESLDLAADHEGNGCNRTSARGANGSALTVERPDGEAVRTLKHEIMEAVWQVADRHEWILSATITGSFLTDETLAAISDIDLVLLVDTLNDERFAVLQQHLDDSLRPFLARQGLDLRINPTLGPLKFNNDATAVLHLMIYSAEAHQQHVIKSPFTCFDWQRSVTFRKRSMSAVYPVFGLQPHHFVSARRGIQDYLHDFERSVISYRELQCTDAGYDELRREAPMTVRDRYEYAYHVMRFLMQNMLKLLQRSNSVADGETLLEQFNAVFPKNAAEHRPLYLELRRRKKARDFRLPIPRLADRLREFVRDFESQFRSIFFDTAIRHLVFRHAPTKLNRGQGDARCFVGRSDGEIEPIPDSFLLPLAAAFQETGCTAVYSSPLARCRQTLEQLGQQVSLPSPRIDDRLIEIDYGRCDGFTIAEAKRAWPELFDAWTRGEDPYFPGGENTSDVWTRAVAFLDEVRRHANGSAAVCTHNVVLRCMVGHGLGVPHADWHRIQVPHMAPVTIVQTRDHGWFIDLEESVERQLFADFMVNVPGSS